MRFTQDDVRRFAEWSRDCNPLHIDPAFARETSFGRTIAHGMLSVLGALREAAPSRAPIAELDVEFRGAVVPDVDYVVARSERADGYAVAVGAGDSSVLNAQIRTVGAEHGATDVDSSWAADLIARGARPPAGVRPAPAAHTIEAFSDGIEVVAAYTTNPAGDAFFGDTAVSGLQARVLGLCSYIVGIEVPGRLSLFTRATISFAAQPAGSDARELWYRVRTTRFDRHFRMLDTRVDVVTEAGAPVASALLRSYVPFGRVATRPEDLAAGLSEQARALGGRVALVCGGSRGLGADISAALALAGVHVYSASRSGGDRNDPLFSALAARGLQVEHLRGDVGDPEWCDGAVQRILAAHGHLDVVVLNACSAPAVLRMGRDASARHQAYLEENLRLVTAPLAASVAALEDSGGSVAYISSAAVDAPPAGWAHYVALKQAAEGLVRTAQQERPVTHAVVARPPRLQTSWSDTPAAAAHAIPAWWSAVHVVNALANGIGSGTVELLTQFPPLASAPEDTAAPAGEAFPIRVAATFTTDPLASGLKFWSKELGLNLAVDMAPYGQVLQALIDPASALAERGGLNVVLLRVRDWLHELSPEKAASIDFLRPFLEGVTRDMERALRAHRARAGAETLLLFAPSYGAASAAESILLRTAEAELAAAVRGLPGLHVASASDHHARYEVDEDAVSDPVREQLAHIPYRDEYYHTLATLIVRHAHRRLAPLRKVVVVDCDNTLWRGVVGEVGPEGLEFDASHLALQQRLNQLTEAGVLIGLCSKNEEADVWAVFEGRADLVLRRDAVIAAAINWQAKSQNLKALAARLNLGLDSFVFIDDNPVECAEVRAGCPEVLTLQWPQEPDRALRLLEHTWELDLRGATAEDQRRTQMYREEFRRQELRDDTLSFTEFIRNLALEVDIASVSPEDLRRAAQLTLRTNQFNFTTRRREEPDLQALVAAGAHDVRTVRVRDRFGDYGLVGLVIAEPQDDVLLTDTFLLSCRVLGRGVEHRIAADLGRMAVDRGLRAVRMRVDTTARNTPARKFLETIAPDDLRRADERGVECEFPAGVLASLQFEAAEQPSYVPADGEGAGESGSKGESGARTAGATAADPGGSLRKREAHIVRTAFELSSPQLLRAAIERPAHALSSVSTKAATSIPSRAAARSGVADAVCRAFAEALRITPDSVREIDRLEALGCDSMKIVEITVALLADYPWLPSTLLFEHRSVSHIVKEIEQLAAPSSEQPVSAAAPATRTASAAHGGAEIAVVGMAVRCAGANSPSELWDLLSRGGSAVVPVPPERKYFLHPLSDARPHWAGLIDGMDQFDAPFFGVSPREAEFMDPQLRLFLEVAWKALEDAGCGGAERDVATGVFAGVMYADYGHRANAGANGDNPYRCWEGFSLANRLSQLLGFRGPSLAVDTACSSSGTALHLACRALNSGDCRVAVVGGVNLIIDPDRFGSLGRLGILSPRGTCEPFGADADGTVLGEGAGVVVLRPLAEAIARGDRIYGVIKGTGLSTGSGTVGFTAPNPQAQAEAIERSVRDAGIDPRTITYVETHGTGTVLGDPIELRGLTLAYSNPGTHDSSLAIRQRCAIGSIKPNTGHLEAGAGVVGLIKVLLQLERGALLPSLTSAQPNPHIPFGESVFTVQRELQAWDRLEVRRNGTDGVVPRRAGLNSFGVGGANAHIIVEEAPATAAPANIGDRPQHLLTLSAKTEETLRVRAQSLSSAIAGEDGMALGDVCFSANVGHDAFDRRVAVVASSREQLHDLLERVGRGEDPKGVVRGEARQNPPRIAFLFTGQGSQAAGMGAQLYRTQPVFRTALDRCAVIFDTLLGEPLLELLFAPEGSDKAALLNQTGYTQPALFAFEYALSELWKSFGVLPDVVMGHSVGELAAMCVAGGVTLDDGLTLIAARGRLMQALPPGGTMTSVMATEDEVLRAIAGAEDRVAIAAINAPSQVVISGAGVAVAEISSRLEADGIRTRALTVSHAFHSPLMKPMLAEYEAVVRRIAFSIPSIPFVSCVDGALVTDAVTQPDYWLRQVMEPVRFTAGMHALRQERVDTFIEIGPSPVLLGMGRQCVDEGAFEWLPSMRKDDDAWTTLLGSLATLYVRGAAIDWRGFDAPYARRRVSLPEYPFERRPYWLRQTTRVSAPQQVRRAEAYEIVWERAAAGASRTAEVPHPTSDTVVVFEDGGGIGAGLAAAVEARGTRTVRVERGARFRPLRDGRYEIDPGSVADLQQLWEHLERDAIGARVRVVCCWALDAPQGTTFTPDHVTSAERIAQQVLHLTQSAATVKTRPVSLWFVTQGAVRVHATSSSSLAQAPLWGLARTIALEHPELWGGIVDIQPDAASGGDLAALVETLLAGDADDQIVLRQGTRYVPRLVRHSGGASLPVRLDPDGTYLVTGGVGALGQHVARWLASRGARHLVLLSRRGGDAGAADTIAALEQASVKVRLAAGDVSRPEDVDRVLAEIEASGAPLRGVVHAAGIDTPVPFAAITADDLRAVLAPKVAGGWLLHEKTRHLDLDLFLCFSSLASVLGAHKRAHYAAANAFLDALVLERRARNLPGMVVNWGPWRGGGMADARQLAEFERIGNYGLDPAAALDVMERASGRVAQVAIADIDWDRFAPVYEARRQRPLIAGLQTPRLEVRDAVLASPPLDTRTIRHAVGDSESGGAEWAVRCLTTVTGEQPGLLETLIQGEVASVLGFSDAGDVSLDKNFYQLGMDSLSMTELVSRLKKRVGFSCTALVFDHPTVRELASTLLPRIIAAAVTVPASRGAEASTPGKAAPSAACETAALRPPETGVTGYAAQSEPGILAFQTEAFPERRADWVAPRFRWMFVDSARRLGVEPRMWLYRDAGRIVGQMGSIPVRVKVGDDVRQSGWLVETMVLEAYRSQAVGSRLIVQAHEEQPFSLSLGQTAEAREILFHLGWKQIAPLQIAQLLVRPENVLKGKVPRPAAWAAGVGLRATGTIRERFGDRSQLQARSIERFSESHDQLWLESSWELGCAVVRDASYLNWKYVDQPGQDFLRIELRDDRGVRGIAVWMVREPDDIYKYRRAFLVDLVTSLADVSMLQRVLRAACAAVTARGADALLCHHIGEPLTRALRGCGFHLRQPERFLLIDPAPLSPSSLRQALAPDSWFVTHGDSDIDRPW